MLLFSFSAHGCLFVLLLQELKAAVASAEVPVRIKFRPPAGKDDDRHQKTCSDFRFNITIYSSAMPRIDLTTDELIVIHAGASCSPPNRTPHLHRCSQQPMNVSECRLLTRTDVPARVYPAAAHVH